MREKLAMKMNSKNWQSKLTSIFIELAASKKLSYIRFNKKIYILKLKETPLERESERRLFSSSATGCI